MVIILNLTPEQLHTINAGLVELPYRIVSPLIDDINRQIQNAFNSAVDNADSTSGATGRPIYPRGIDPESGGQSVDQEI